MIDWDHEILDDYYGLDKFCEFFGIKLKPYQKKMIWLSTKSNSSIETIITNKISRPTGLKSEFFIVDEEVNMILGTCEWEEIRGTVTPGGDPYWICPNCGGDGHIMGIESTYNHHNECKECNTRLIYPWEKE